MPREKEGFRDQLESIIAFHPSGECMAIQAVAAYTGRSKEYVTKHFNFNGSGHGQYITRTQLARELCS